MNASLNHEGSDLHHEENLAFLREGKGGLTLGATYYGTEEQYRQAHGLDLETPELDIPGEGSNLHPEAVASTELGEGTNLRGESSTESKPQDETTIPLLPGIAVYRPDGLLPVIIEGESAPAPVWSLPGDFQRYLQPGEPETRASGLVREILVGSYRNPADDDNDDPAYLGTFIPDSEWDAVVGAVHRGYLHLVEEIGFDPSIERPDESKPRGESWLAERAHWESETAKWEAEFVKVKAQLATATATAPSALPANALELIQAAGGLSKPKAEAVLTALFPEVSEAPPV